METNTELATAMAEGISVKAIMLPAGCIYNGGSARVEKAAKKLLKAVGEVEAAASLGNLFIDTAEKKLDDDYVGSMHNYAGNEDSSVYYCTPVLKIDVGVKGHTFQMVVEMHDAESGEVVRQAFSWDWCGFGQITDYKRDKAGRFVKRSNLWEFF